jgi:hypothetical protein
MSAPHRIVYMCEVCLLASDTPLEHHGRLMIQCDAGCEGDDCTQPVVDATGHILTRAPKWWVLRHKRTPGTHIH